MAREWPATTAASLIALIDDPRHKVTADAPRGSPPSRPRPSSTCAARA